MPDTFPDKAGLSTALALLRKCVAQPLSLEEKDVLVTRAYSQERDLLIGRASYYGCFYAALAVRCMLDVYVTEQHTPVCARQTIEHMAMIADSAVSRAKAIEIVRKHFPWEIIEPTLLALIEDVRNRPPRETDDDDCLETGD